MKENSLSSKSFELVFYEPSSKFDGRTHFRDDEKPSLTTEQRIEYLKNYARLIKEFNDLETDSLAIDAVPEKKIREAVAKIKEKPNPAVRKVVPLRIWKWKLLDKEQNSEDWVKKDYDDSLWNELETPRLVSMNRPLLLRTNVDVAESERMVLDIESIIDDYAVWVNGKRAFEHEGYESVTAEITEFVTPEENNCLAILVNKKNPDDELIGIAGEISLVNTNKIFMEDLFIYTDEIDEKSVTVKLDVTLNNNLSHNFEGKIVASFYEWFPEEKTAPCLSKEIDVEVEANKKIGITKSFTIENAKLWSLNTPNLYKVSLTLKDKYDKAVDDYVETTGFKMIRQRDGRIYLNNKQLFVKSFGDNLGFAPAFGFHGQICPTDEQMMMDFLLAKEANANSIRLHPWGFTGQRGKYNEYGWPEWGLPNGGTNYARIAEIADQVGICLTWVTRHWSLWVSGYRHNLRGKVVEERLIPSVKRVRNHPCIIIYEGLNEVNPGVKRVDTSTMDIYPLLPPELQDWEKLALKDAYIKGYQEFCRKYVEVVNSVDNTRLVSPDSPWGPYYQNNKHWIPMDPPDIFYTENTFWDAHAYFGWYADFKNMYTLHEHYWLENKKRPFMLTECAAEAMPDWRAYKELPWYGIWLNNGEPCAAIERVRLGRPLRILGKDSEIGLSQAYQGLCIQQTVNYLRSTGADGVNINLIADGLAEGNYHKGVTDLYRKAKLGFFVTKMVYHDLLVTGMDGDFVLSQNDELNLKVVNDLGEAKALFLRVLVKDMDGRVVDRFEKDVKLDGEKITSLGRYKINGLKKGLYQLEYQLHKRKNRPASSGET